MKYMLGTNSFSNNNLLEKCVNSWYGDIYKVVYFDGANYENVFSEFFNKGIDKKLDYYFGDKVHIGCGAGWNKIMNYCFNEKGFDTLIMVGSDTEMKPNFIEDIIWDFEERKLEFATHTLFSFTCWMMTKNCFEKIGYWDENFFPAYHEDCDYDYRRKLANINFSIVGHFNYDFFNHYGSATIKTNPDFEQRNHKTFVMNVEYYKYKWGGLPCQETYLTPYNDSNLTLKDWKIQQDTYDIRKKIWNVV